MAGAGEGALRRDSHSLVIPGGIRPLPNNKPLPRKAFEAVDSAPWNVDGRIPGNDHARFPVQSYLQPAFKNGVVLCVVLDCEIRID